MRRFVGGICVTFAVLLAASIYIAMRFHDGPVETEYYRRSLSYFKDRENKTDGPDPALPVGSANGRTVLLDIVPKPVRAMRELVFTVEIPGESLPGRPWIELGMAGMAMPSNRVDLSADGNGRYRGKGTVVRCPSGGRTWTATVNIPGSGTVPFTFDVAD